MGRQNFRTSSKVFFLGEENGFTLIEILTTIAIVAVLSVLAIALLNPKKQIAKAKDARRETDLKKIAIALEDYLGDHACYPEETDFASCNSGNLSPYLRTIPCDPTSNLPYLYKRGPTCDKFILAATLETRNQTVVYKYNDVVLGNFVVTSPNYRLAPVGPGPTEAEPTGAEPTVGG